MCNEQGGSEITQKLELEVRQFIPYVSKEQEAPLVTDVLT